MNLTDVISQMTMHTVFQSALRNQTTIEESLGQSTDTSQKSDFKTMLQEKRQEVSDAPTEDTKDINVESKNEPQEEEAVLTEEEVAAVVAMQMQPVIPLVQVEQNPDSVTEVPTVDTTVSMVESTVEPAVGTDVLVQTAETVTQMTAETVGTEPELVQQVVKPEGNTEAQSTELSPETEQSVETLNQPTETLNQPVKSTETDVQTQTETQQMETGDQTDVEVVDVESGAASLFKETESLPVKVGDTVTVNAESTEFDVQMADTLTDAVETGLQKVELKLTPEHLGTVTVELTRGQDGVLQIVMRTENHNTLKLLSEHSHTLSALLQGNGQKSEVRVDVPQTQDSQQLWQEHEQEKGQQQHQNSRQQEQKQSSSEDFFHQLRLGLFQTEVEI